MSEKVVGIFGEPSPLSGEVQPGVVDTLVDLLERARAGKIQGLGFVILLDDEMVNYASVGIVGHLRMVGAAFCLTQDLAASQMAPSDD